MTNKDISKIIDILVMQGEDNLADLVDDLYMDIKALRALHAAGVDNWEGYEYALEMLNE